MTNKEQHNEILQQLEALYEAYAKEVANYVKKSGFDEFNPRCQKKIQSIADKYAKYIRPLQEEANVLAEKINIELEEERKKQYLTVSEYEQMKNKIENKK